MSSKTKRRAKIVSDSDDMGSSDIEQELKAQKAKRHKPAPVATTAHSSSSGSSSGSDDEWTMGEKKGVEKEKKKANKGGKGGQIGKRMPAGRKMAPARPSTSGSSHDDDEGEEQARESQGGSSESSGDSSSSDSESSSDESLQFDDGLDEDLVGDEEDRSKLSNMTDIEREQEMYMRYEKRQMQKTRFEIEHKLRRERRAKKKKAREQVEREQNRVIRSSRRSRLEDSSKSKAIDELKAKRSADKQKREEVQETQAPAARQAAKEPLNAAEVYPVTLSQRAPLPVARSLREETQRMSPGAALRYISNLEELTKIKLSRFRLEKWVHMPFFRDVAVGCYVRVGIGAHEGRMVYRVCEITEVIENQKVYSLGPTKTNKCLRLRHGPQERSFRMEYVSNSPFTDSEFSKWKTELAQRGQPLPTVDFIRKKSKRIEQAKSFQFKEEDIDKIILEKQKFRKAPTNYAMTKNRLFRRKELAEEDGDTETVSALTQELLELEEKAEQLDKQRSKGLSAISYINERNRQRNVSRAEEALKAELAVDKMKDDDPFTRRRCKPTLVTLTKDVVDGSGTVQGARRVEGDKKSTQEEVAAADKTSRPSTPNGQKLASLGGGDQSTPNASLLSSTPAPPTSSSASSSHDLFSAHDFDIQIDLPSTPEGTTSVKTLNKSAVTSTPRTNDAPKRSLNLADYKKRRGLI
ncbi:RNA polymerase-associated protein RTF1 homolog [Geodia barretti]|uniref:RNA polymerase-associated protein RTF1 homolog n=1 Tax=Geodia barretti TaxID=519541 RepID=A0AA35T8Y6_GEOBA|nr:RNA polymerase-associated protein RTF1 homolog [Geodia barretti]